MSALSQRRYASHRRARGLPGGSRESVRRAIETGRLSASLTPDRSQIADPDLADREWAASTLEDRIPITGRPAAASAPPPPAPLDGAPRSPPPPLHESRARREAAAAALAERKLREHEGGYIEIDRARADVIAAYTVVRTRLLGVPSRLRQRDATLTVELLELLDELIREALEDLAEGGAC